MTADKINDMVCPHQLSFLLDNFLRRLFQKPEDIVGGYICEGDTVIDLGCGPGFFTLDMAEMAGAAGRVIAVDIQERMLETVGKKAAKYGLSDRISLHKTVPGKSGLDSTVKADFILAYYMIHETGNYCEFLEDVKRNLKEGGKFLIVEPSVHVSKNKYEKLLSEVESLGYKVIDKPSRKGGRSVLLTV